MQTIRVILVADAPITRQGMRKCLEAAADIQVVAEATYGDQSLTLDTAPSADVVVVYASEGQTGWQTVATRMKLANPRARFLALLSNHDNTIAPLMNAGVTGLLLNTTSGEQLAQGIRSVHAGQLVLDALLGAQLLDRSPPSPSSSGKQYAALTNRELQVLRVAASGLPNRQIAFQLRLSERTIRGYLTAIFSKIGASSRTEAVVIGLKQGWLSLDRVSLEGEAGSSQRDEPPIKLIAADDPDRGGEGRIPVVEGHPSDRGILAGTILDARLSSNERYLDMVDSINEGFWVVQNEKFVVANRVVAEMLGYSQRELVGKPLVEVLPSHLQGPIMRLYRKRLAGDVVPGRYSLTLLGASYSAVPARVSVSTVSFRRGKAVGAVVSDIRGKQLGEDDILNWIARTAK